MYHILMELKGEEDHPEAVLIIKEKTRREALNTILNRLTALYPEDMKSWTKEQK